MNKILLVVALIAAVFMSGCVQVPDSQPEENQTNIIVIKDFAFIPSMLTIRNDTVVTWVNEDSVPHTIKILDFESQVLSKGQTFNRIFNEKGTFEYSCGLHPNMKGKVVVE
ncbi:MAG: cupredoxin domain-containing protein [Candidatus Aenigmatarchaeota archaeon]